MRDLVFDPMLPVPLICLVGIIVGAATVSAYLATGAAMNLPQRLGLLILRLLGIALVLAMLLQPSREEHHWPPAVERVTLVGVDSSLSMKQRDVNQGTRFEAARSILLDSGAVLSNGTPGDPRLRFFHFSDDAAPVPGSMLDLEPRGQTTRFHKSVTTMLAAAGDALPNAIILLTDGHDFELVNPAKTGAAARSRKVPIYAVAVGRQGKVRDVSARITNFQPYCYVKQKARITAALRLIGCEFEDLTVQLLRHGEVAQARRINASELQEITVEFEVVEPEVGQYEYEVRVQPLEKETETSNNSAITYLNVIDQQIKVLLLEGDPYWDTTFLQRSLMRNDKFNVDALISYGPGKVRAIRKTATGEMPGKLEKSEDFAVYDVVVLGRKVNELLDPLQAALLDEYARDRGGVVVFCRGRAFESENPFGELEPVLWGEEASAPARLDPTAEGRALSPFRSVLQGAGGLEELPDLVAARESGDRKPLTSTLAVAGASGAGVSAGAGQQYVPAIVHRRYGQGQVVSVGVEGLWRWGLNAKADGPNTPFDRFWDQMMLWLLAGRDFIPNKQFSFRPNSANILLGEKVLFRLHMRNDDPNVKSVPVTISHGASEAGRVAMMPSLTDHTRLTAEFLPERVGRYTARADFPDGTRQESRFIVYSENLEETEVATDVLCLRRLCESSGGRVLEPAELARLLTELNTEKASAAPETRICPVWNQAWVFCLCGVLFGLDWFLRRRWGLC
jgi:hypothetical protein